MRKACKVGGRPSIHQFVRLLDKDEDLRKQYARAREIQADYIAAECVEIADTDSDPQRARVRVDARKWYASKLKPKVYGDKLDITSAEQPIGGAVSRSEAAALLAQANELERRVNGG